MTPMNDDPPHATQMLTYVVVVRIRTGWIQPPAVTALLEDVGNLDPDGTWLVSMKATKPIVQDGGLLPTWTGILE